tara:strand:- start:3237 stop:4019 length:783 start_codon:yes stop_codon:yes gene_type:complete
MANQLFKNFPSIQYTLDSGKVVRIKDFFRKAKVETSALDQLIEYQTYEISEGERPDVVATKLYGDGDLHWTFFLVNDFDNYYDWFMDFEIFENYITEKYQGQNLIVANSSDIVKTPTYDPTLVSTDNPLGHKHDNKILIGETLTSGTKEVSVLSVDPTFNRVVVKGDTIEANDVMLSKTNEVFGTNLSFTVQSVSDAQDGVHHYVDSVGNKRTYGGSGWTPVTHYTEEFEENEEKRLIKIISPKKMPSVLREFERIMSND